MSKQEKESKISNTLRDEDIVTQPEGGRRSVLAVVGVTVLGAASKALGGCIVANPQPVPAQQVVTGGGTVMVQQAQTGVTDGDAGEYSDPVNGGRGGMRGMYTGLTDGDSGTYSDPSGQGRGHYGRGGQTGLTDGDAGAYSDPVGNGRGTARLGQTNITDSDGGQWADSVGHGRGHR
jgi:hypothetical protein